MFSFFKKRIVILSICILFYLTNSTTRGESISCKKDIDCPNYPYRVCVPFAQPSLTPVLVTQSSVSENNTTQVEQTPDKGKLKKQHEDHDKSQVFIKLEECDLIGGLSLFENVAYFLVNCQKNEIVSVRYKPDQPLEYNPIFKMDPDTYIKRLVGVYQLTATSTSMAVSPASSFIRSKRYGINIKSSQPQQITNNNFKYFVSVGQNSSIHLLSNGEFNRRFSFGISPAGTINGEEFYSCTDDSLNRMVTKYNTGSSIDDVNAASRHHTQITDKIYIIQRKLYSINAKCTSITTSEKDIFWVEDNRLFFGCLKCTDTDNNSNGTQPLLMNIELPDIKQIQYHGEKLYLLTNKGIYSIDTVHGGFDQILESSNDILSMLIFDNNRIVLMKNNSFIEELINGHLNKIIWPVNSNNNNNLEDEEEEEENIENHYIDKKEKVEVIKNQIKLESQIDTDEVDEKSECKCISGFYGYNCMQCNGTITLLDNKVPYCIKV